MAPSLKLRRRQGRRDVVHVREGVPVTDPRYRLGVKPPNAGKKYPAEILTRDEIRALMRACGHRSNTAARNQALIVVLWRCGLRVAEALALMPKDVDLVLGTVAVLHGKGDQRRIVGIDPEAAAVVGRWLERRAALGLNGRHPLFCTVARPMRGGKLWDSYVRERLHELGEKAGIEKRVHPHGLRHTHATELVREGVPLTVIRRQLGHNRLDTTQRYVDHLTPKDVIDAMQARTWAP
jgi:site-specific recombinase XerD